MKSINESESQYLYLLKGIACFLVVFIHYGITSMGKFYELTRVAVPIFFIIQGRFLATPMSGKTVRECKEKNVKTLIKLIKSTVLVTFMYILLSFYLWVVSNGMSFAEWINMKFAPIELFKLFVFNSSKVIYDMIVLFDHQWYLYATITAVFIIVLLQKFVNKYFLFVLMSPLVMRLVDQYTFQIAKKGIWILGEQIEEILLVRNFLFTALPFLAYGMFLQYIQKEKYSRFMRNFLKVMLLLGCVLGVVLTYIENKVSGGQELYIGSVLFAISVTTISRFIDFNCKSVLSWIGKYLSKDIYFWHPFIATVLMGIVRINVDWMILPYLICLYSILIALLILGVRKLYERKK